MNQVTTFYANYHDSRKEYEVRASYIDYEDMTRREFQFRCDKEVLEKLAKDVLSQHQLEMLDRCPACGGKDICQKCGFSWRDENKR